MYDNADFHCIFRLSLVARLCGQAILNRAFHSYHSVFSAGCPFSSAEKYLSPFKLLHFTLLGGIHFMKKAIHTVTVILILCAFIASAFAQQAQIYTLEGLVTEVGDSYFIMEDAGLGTVRVNLDEALTAYDGVAAKDAMAVGLYVYVRYNGVLTRSIPPQVTAEKVSCFVVTGTVAEILDNGFTVEGDAVMGTVMVHGYDGMPPVYKGVPITLYYSGVMALSYPPQITAAYVIVPMISGTVSQVEDSGFTLTTTDGISYAVAITGDTQLLSLPADGEAMTVFYASQADDSGNTVNALVVSAQEAQGEAVQE
jgi:hypothetical protein